MTKSFRCRDAGAVCNAEVKGETEDEVLEAAVAHAREDHGVELAGSSTLAGYVRSLIRDSGDDADRGEG